jgi:hypothetical protein
LRDILPVPDTKFKDCALRLEQEIQSFQQELNSPMEGAVPAMGKLAVGDAQRLKRTIDDFRLFLWAYSEAWAGKRSDTAAALQRIRLQATADMLNLLRGDFAGKTLPDTPEAQAIRRALRDFTQTVVLEY